MIKIIHDVKTNKIEEVELTASEIALIEKQNQELEKKFESQNKEILKKQIARESALAKLAALGLTEEEIAAL